MKTFGVWNVDNRCWAADKAGKIMEFISEYAANEQASIEGCKCAYRFVPLCFNLANKHAK